MSPHAICYWIALTDNEPYEYSPFQGFSPALLSRGRVTAQILKTLPSSVFELYAPGISMLQARLAGLSPYSIRPMIASELVKLEVSVQSPFWVVFTDDETHSIVQAWSIEQAIPVLVINTSKVREPLDSLLLSRLEMITHCDAVIAYLQRTGNDFGLVPFERLQSEKNRDHLMYKEIDLYNHNTTIPNELILLSIGCTAGTALPPLVGHNDKYVAAITSTADRVAYLRSQVPNSPHFRSSPPLYSIVLTSPGMLLATRKSRRPKGGDRRFFDALRVMQSQTEYSFIGEANLLTDRVFHTVMRLRVDELNAYTDAISVWACSYLTPVLRLRPAVNHTRPEAIKLADAIRGESQRPTSKPPLRIEKLRKVVNQLFVGLKNSVDEEFIKRLSQGRSHVKIVSDAPLEWLPMKGLPLMLRQSTSRIPTTPGNSFYQQMLPRPQTRLSMNDFSEVLVVRSFQDYDPLRRHLQDALSVTKLSNGNSIPARFVDVRNRSELIRAFETFKGALAVFDCHGMHRLEDDTATLCLRDENVDVFSIRSEVRIPPILFTCVCDTHALARDHATSGSGFLSCGAETVVATVLPVESFRAVLFAVRLLFRIYELLPQIVNEENRGVIRWDQVVSLMQRMLFVTEYSMMVKTHHRGSKDWELRTQQRGNMVIHQEGFDWFEKFLKVMADESKMSVRDLEALRREHLPFPETYKYIQLGHPELIIVGPSKPDAEDIPILERAQKRYREKYGDVDDPNAD